MSNTNKLKQVQGQAKQQWAEGNGALMETIDGKRDEFVGVVQEKYGRAIEKVQEVTDNLIDKKEQAKQKVDDRLHEYNDKMYEAAKNLPGDMNETITRYPWITVVTMVSLGIILGFWFKRCR